MKPPWLLRLAPLRFKSAIYLKYYHAQSAAWAPLFETSSLAFAPELRMQDLVPGDVISGHIAFTGFYDLELSRYLWPLAKKGGLLVDVGANMGYFSLLWAGLNPSNRVQAFEASPRNVALLENNIRQNNLSDRITLIPRAAGRQAGILCFDTGPREQTGWGGFSPETNATTIDVPVVRVDEVLPHEPIDLLKIDVEGGDTWVLLGCEALLKKRLVRAIVFEQNKPRMKHLGINPQEARDFLKQLNYACVPLTEQEGEWIAYPNP